MSASEHLPAPVRDLIDDYLSELLDEAGVQRLEGALRENPAARAYFIRYARLHTDLHLEVRSRRLSERVLERIQPAAAARRGKRRARLTGRWAVATAAGVLLALAAMAWLSRTRELAEDQAVAWLVNAQNCTWADGEQAGPMRAGSVLDLERGLAELRFQSGARVVLQGPARLALLSNKAARLLHGKLTARVPTTAAGFEILAPQGKVIDLGTEFGLSVTQEGGADVYVFEGKVEAYAGAADAVSLSQNQAARIEAGRVTVQPAEPGGDQFVRAIVPPPVIVPRTFRLAFDGQAADGVRDRDGHNTGLSHRLPGTGRRLPARDPNLRLDAEARCLELTTTNSDLNTQYKLDRGEYLGIRLADLGFTGKEDFTVSVTLPNIPALKEVGQFGLYAGPKSDRNIRGGLLASPREPGQYTQFLVHNRDGADAEFGRVGLLSPGASLAITLRRSDGKYSLTLENLTTKGTSTLTVEHPEFLDAENDLYVGLFGANTQSDVRKTLVVKEFAVTVFTTAAPPKERP